MGVTIERETGRPACHAFIVGVGAYPHLHEGPAQQFGFAPLHAAARSARHVHDWIVNAKLALPLASVRLLLSPVADELLPAGVGPCTLDNFIRDAHEWRQAASSHRDNMTFFYFAGHGFSPSRGEQLLVLQDFGDGIGPLLRNTVSINNIVYGMAPDDTPDIARTQLYFIDADRQRATILSQYQALNSTAVFDAQLQGLDDRTAAVFYATAPERPAYMDPLAHTLFCQALLEGLDGAAAQPTPDDRWGVSVISLSQYLPRRVAELAAEHGVVQMVGIEGALGETVISYLDEPPTVPITIDVDAANPNDSTDILILDGEGRSISEWKSIGHGHNTVQVPAGLYQLVVTGERAGTPYKRHKVFLASPTSTVVKVKP